jgi:alpha-tubulin suppressor-like RCC1 family protein
VLLYGGAVYCWGENSLGELGDGSLAGTNTCDTNVACRPAPQPVSGLTDVAQISVTFQHSCAVKQDGSVWCWGVNSNLELGHANSSDMNCAAAGASTPIPCNPVPARVSLPGGVLGKAAATGRRYSCVLTTTGDVYCWGDNTWGQLGVQLTTTGSSTPQRVGSSSSASSVFPAPVSAISSDHNDYPHVCALSNGGIWCWGASNSGQNGHDPAADPACGATTCNFTPQPIKAAQGSALTGVTSFGIGRGFGCALKTDGTVWCWGADGSWGALGQGSASVSSSTPLQVNMPLPSQIAALSVGGGNAVFAVDATGAVWSWGRNNYGLLGNGTVTGAEPTPKATGFSGPVQISAGEGVVLALKPDGSVWLWGDNSAAQLGHVPGTRGDQMTAGGESNPLPAMLSGLP